MASAPAARVAPRVPRLSAADRFVLRLALGAALGFAVALVLDWQFSFLAPMLAVQLLAAMPACPGFRQGIAIPLVMLLATNAALAASTLLADAPAVLLMIIGLVICWTFYVQRRGAPGLIMLLIQISFCSVPLYSTISLDLSHELSDFLQKSTVAAIAIVWICYALVPAPAPPPRPAGAAAAPTGLPPAQAAWVAISDSIVLLPLLVNFMIGHESNNLVIVITTINLLREVGPGKSNRIAVGLLVGNVLGGILAVFAQQFVLVADNLVQFLLTVFLAGLLFGSRLARGGPTAGIFALAFGTFLLLLGLAVTPLPGGSEEAFVIRILKIGLASLYALGALSLVARLRREPPIVGPGRSAGRQKVRRGFT